MIRRLLSTLAAVAALAVTPLVAQDKPKEKPVKVVADLGYVTWGFGGEGSASRR